MYIQFLTQYYVSGQLDKNMLMYNEIFKWGKMYKYKYK